MGEGLKRVAAQCGGLVVKDRHGNTVTYDAKSRNVAPPSQLDFMPIKKTTIRAVAKLLPDFEKNDIGRFIHWYWPACEKAQIDLMFDKADDKWCWRVQIMWASCGLGNPVHADGAITFADALTRAAKAMKIMEVEEGVPVEETAV